MSRRPRVLPLLVLLSVGLDAGPGHIDVEHVHVVGLTLSSLVSYQQQRFSVPLQYSLYYRARFADSNNALKSRALGAGIPVFF